MVKCESCKYSSKFSDGVILCEFLEKKICVTANHSCKYGKQEKKMKDLIDRQAAIELVGDLVKGILSDSATISMKMSPDYLFENLYKPIRQMPSAQPDTSCDGCRYGYFGNAVCDRCSRMYTDRYEREVKKDAAD